MTSKDILRYINDMTGGNTGVSQETLRILMNDALKRYGQCYEKTWDSSDFTMTSNVISLPSDLRNITTVKYSEYVILPTTPETLSSLYLDWESETGDIPTYYIQNGNTLELYPRVSSISNLTIRGMANIPDYTADVSRDDPIEYIPAEYRIGIAYYVLSMLPADNDIKLARIQRFYTLWDNLIKDYKSNEHTTNTQRFTY